MPVTVADIHEWINDGKFLYYRASREVPLGMRERLPPGYQALLEPQDLLQPESLHHSILDMAVLFNKDVGMAIPPLNVSLVLYRWIQSLMLPLEIFAATQRLARLLEVDLSTFIASKASKNIVLRYPEAQLMALVVVATKLLFPFDDVERRAYEPTDLSSLSLDWDAWVKLHKPESDKSAEQPQLSFHQAFQFSESDCLSAADERLDAYLDWYEENVASEEVRERGRARNDAEFRRTLFQMFPTPARQSMESNDKTPADVNRLPDAHGTLLRERVVQPQESKNVNRIGIFYRRFRTVEELSGPATLLYESTAALACLSVESMVQAVFLTERKLQKFEEGLRKAAQAVDAG
jgi:RNA polymerase I-specific transcription initiation factor RRN7